MNRGLAMQNIPPKVETPCYCSRGGGSPDDAPVSAITDGWAVDGGRTLYLFVYCAKHRVTTTILIPKQRTWA